MQTLKSNLRERALLIAGCATVLVVLLMLLTRPAPTDLIDESGAETEQTEQAKSKQAGEPAPVPPQGDDSSISAKQGERPAAEEGTSSAPLAPSEAAVGSPVAIVRPPNEPFNTLEVNSVDSWNNAVRNAQPGDTIKLVGTVNAVLRFNGQQAPDGKKAGRDGTAERPITITAAPDVWIDPGNQNNNLPALDLFGTTHVHVNGVNVRNSQFGIRIQQGTGAEGAPVIIANNTVTDTGHAGIHVAGDVYNHSPSSYVRVEANRVTRTGRTAPQYGEGIYLGYGGREWIDHSNNLWVVNNEISETTAEGIDIKPGTRNVIVDGNQIHDLSPISGGAISAHYVNESANPDPGTPGNVLVANNRIWNVNLDGRAGANDWAIWVGHGGVTIENNAIWGMRNNPGSTRAIRVRGLADFGPHPVVIQNNLFWTATGWVAEGAPLAQNINASGNQGPNGAKGVEVGMQADAGAPALGAGGLADNGGGPGSALGFTYQTPNMPELAPATGGGTGLPGAGREGQAPQFGS